MGLRYGNKFVCVTFIFQHISVNNETKYKTLKIVEKHKIQGQSQNHLRHGNEYAPSA